MNDVARPCQVVPVLVGDSEADAGTVETSVRSTPLSSATGGGKTETTKTSNRVLVIVRCSGCEIKQWGGECISMVAGWGHKTYWYAVC